MNGNIKFLDGLRGMAALIVMIGHARAQLWEGYSAGYKLHPELYSTIDKITMYFFSVFKYGHEMVLLFFLISGFVIHYKYANVKQNIDLNYGRFILKRFKRIYPPFIFCLILAYIIDSIGRYYNFSIYDNSTPYLNINNNVNSEISLNIFILNIFMLMTVYAPAFGSTGVTWSLMYEWWFYVIYPFTYKLIKKYKIGITTLIIITFYILSYFGNNWHPKLFWKIMDSFILWWIGLLISHVYSNTYLSVLKTKYLSVILVFSSFLMFFIFRLYKIDNPHLLDLQICLLFAGIILILLHLKKDNVFVIILERLKWLGDYSFTLYLVHGTILMFLSGLIINFYKQLPTHHYFVIIFIIFINLFSYFVHLLIEKPFSK